MLARAGPAAASGMPPYVPRQHLYAAAAVVLAAGLDDARAQNKHAQVNAYIETDF